MNGQETSPLPAFGGLLAAGLVILILAVYLLFKFGIKETFALFTIGMWTRRRRNSKSDSRPHKEQDKVENEG
jgi:hypothetical protein